MHDADAALILEKLLALRAGAGLLRFAPDARAARLLVLGRARRRAARSPAPARRRASPGSARRFGYASAQSAIAAELARAIPAFACGTTHRRRGRARCASRPATSWTSSPPSAFASSPAPTLACCKDAFVARPGRDRRAPRFDDDLRALEAHPAERFGFARAWVDGFVARRRRSWRAPLRPRSRGASRHRPQARSPAELGADARDHRGLLGRTPRIEGRTMALVLDELLERVGGVHRRARAAFRAYRALRAADRRAREAPLRLDEFTPRVISSFVRNRLIDEVYLPLVGANLAKQLGAAGAKKRTDQMGMLLLVSPPGYGKTTLMEYVASRLGLVFVKVNGPALGHEVTSLDPDGGAERDRAPGGREDQPRARDGQQRDALSRRHPAHVARAAAEVHLAVRRAAQDRGRVEGAGRAPTICAARSSAS